MLEEKEKKEIDSLFEEKDKITKRLDEINERLEEIRLKEITDITQMEIGAYYLYNIYASDSISTIYFQWTDKCKLEYNAELNFFRMILDCVYFENIAESHFSIMSYNICVSPENIGKQLHTITKFNFEKRVNEFIGFITKKFQLQ